MKHHPVLYATGRFGCWCTCSCDWTSPTRRTVLGAHLDFGRHLLDAAKEDGAHAADEAARD